MYYLGGSFSRLASFLLDVTGLGDTFLVSPFFVQTLEVLCALFLDIVSISTSLLSLFSVILVLLQLLMLRLVQCAVVGVCNALFPSNAGCADDGWLGKVCKS